MKQGTVQPSPPLLQQCLMHESAMRPGFPLSLHPLCPCCYQPSNKKPFGLCFSEIQTLYLGTGVALFFRFVIMCFVVVLLPLSAYSILQLVSNLQQNTVSTSFVFTISNLNSLSSHNQMHSYILAAVIIVLILLTPMLTKLSLRILNRACSNQNQYFYPQILALSFELKNPAESLTQADVIRTLNDWCEVDLKINRKPIRDQLDVVQAVYFHFNLTEFSSLMQQIEQLQRQKKIQERQQQVMMQGFENYHKDVKNYSSKKSFSSKHSYNYNTMKKKFARLDELYEKVRDQQIEKTQKFTVVFKQSQYMELVKQKTQYEFCNNYINKLVFPNNNSVIACDAPFPCEINYSVQHFSQKFILKRRLLSWLLTVIIIIAGSGLEYLVVYLLKNVLIIDSMVSSLLMAGGIYLIGEIGLKLCLWLIPYECQLDKTSQNCSSNIHLMTVGLFLRCLSIFVVFCLLVGQLSTSVTFVETLTCLIVIWSLLILVSRLINFGIIRTCLTKLKAKTALNQGKISKEEANKMFERPESQLNLQYAQFNILVFSTFVFASIIPVALIVCSISLIISYVVERISFTYIQRQPFPSNHRLFLLMAGLLWKCTVGLTLGHFYFIFACEQLGYAQTTEIKIIYSILLAIGCVLFFVPARIFDIKPENSLTYQKIAGKIVNSYGDFNNPYSVQLNVEVPKQPIPQAVKNQMLAEQLNTMSKSLETTLRDKIFNKKNPALEALNNRDEDSLYFQFDEKVEMPPKKQNRKSSVPPIFKQDRSDLLLKKKSKTNNLIKLTHLVTSQQETEIKNRIKTAIKDSIHKIQ